MDYPKRKYDDKLPYDQNVYPYRLNSCHKIVIMKKNDYLCTNKRKKYREKDKEEQEEHRTDAYR